MMGNTCSCGHLDLVQRSNDLQEQNGLHQTFPQNGAQDDAGSRKSMRVSGKNPGFQTGKLLLVYENPISDITVQKTSSWNV